MHARSVICACTLTYTNANDKTNAKIKVGIYFKMFD